MDLFDVIKVAIVVVLGLIPVAAVGYALVWAARNRGRKR